MDSLPELRLKKPMLWLPGFLFVAAMLIPATREILILDLRILLRLHGKTYAQGQAPGCAMLIIPNNRFSDAYEQELRRRSATSPDAYALAATLSSSNELEPPAPEKWRTHPMRNWAVFRLALATHWLHDRIEIPNLAPQVLDNASRLVRMARNAEPDNGALALAEASIHFSAHADEQALEALESAVEIGNWRADAAQAWLHHKETLRKEGLTDLDARIEAMRSASDSYASSVSSDVKSALRHLMAKAIGGGNQHEFSRLFKLLKRLQERKWQDYGLRNSFISFHPDDELIDAMARSLNREMPVWKPGENIEEIQVIEQKRKELTKDLLASMSELEVGEFGLQGKPEGPLKKKSTNEQFRDGMREEFWASLWGTFGLLFLSLAVLTVIACAPFRFADRTSTGGFLPRGRRFWLGLAGAMAVSVLVAHVPMQELCCPFGFGPPPSAFDRYYQQYYLAALVFGMQLACVWMAWVFKNNLPPSGRLALGLNIFAEIISSWRLYVLLWLITLPFAAWFRCAAGRLIMQDNFGL